jgi:hypothetical protein
MALTSKHLESPFPEKHLYNPDDDNLGQKEDVTVEPFSLLDSISILDEIQAQLPRSAKISDAYPCTGLQEGLLALSMKSGGSFTPQIICKLPIGVNLEKLKVALADFNKFKYCSADDLCANKVRAPPSSSYGTGVDFLVNGG